jgi:hypothetical protein
LEREAGDAAASGSPAPKAGGRRRDVGKKTTIANQGVDGVISAEAELDQENDAVAVADVTTELKKAQIEDKEDDAAIEAQT